MNLLRAALTETRNACVTLPATLDRLSEWRGRLDEVRAANLQHHLHLLREAARRGARLIGFGELFTAPYFALHRDPLWLDLAEDIDSGPTAQALSAIARELGVVIVAPIYELAGERRFNTALVIDADGQRLGSFRKLHIPEGSNEQGAFCEPYYYQRSDGRMRQLAGRVSGVNDYLPVFDTAVGRIGVAICYDRHFEGVMSGLARGGAQVILSPAVTFGAKSRRMWDMEFPVEAARHNVFIGGSNKRGVEPPFTQEYFGASYFVGPNGRLENHSDHPELIIADLPLDDLERADPAGWNLQRDARPEIRG